MFKKAYSKYKLKFFTDKDPKKETTVGQNAARVGSLLFLSRILGMIREVIISRFVDIKIYDLYTVADKIPSIIRRLSGEGVLDYAYIPPLSEFDKEREAKESSKWISSMCGMFVTFVLILVYLAIITSDFWAAKLLSSYTDPDTLKIFTDFFGMQVPMVVFYFLSSTFIVILLRYEVFGHSHIGQPIANVFKIGVLLVGYSLTDSHFVLGLSALTGAVAHIIWQYYGTRKISRAKLKQRFFPDKLADILTKLIGALFILSFGYYLFQTAWGIKLATALKISFPVGFEKILFACVTVLALLLSVTVFFMRKRIGDRSLEYGSSGLDRSRNLLERTNFWSYIGLISTAILSKISIFYGYAGYINLACLLVFLFTTAMMKAKDRPYLFNPDNKLFPLVQAICICNIVINILLLSDSFPSLCKDLFIGKRLVAILPLLIICVFSYLNINLWLRLSTGIGKRLFLLSFLLFMGLSLSKQNVFGLLGLLLCIIAILLFWPLIGFKRLVLHVIGTYLFIFPNGWNNLHVFVLSLMIANLYKMYQDNFNSELLSDKVKGINRNFIKSFSNSMFGVGVNQIISLVTIGVAAKIGHGAPSYISRTDKLVQVPINLIAVPFGLALLPRLSKLVAERKNTEAQSIYNKVIVTNILLSFGAIILSHLLSKALANIFLGGKTKIADVQIISYLFKLELFGLPAWVLSKVLASVYFATNKSNILFRAAILQCCLNVPIKLAIWKLGLGVKAFPIASVIGAWANALFLLLNHNESIDLFQPMKKLLGMKVDEKRIENEQQDIKDSEQESTENDQILGDENPRDMDE